MPTRYYTKDHEWISVDGDMATVGITAFAASQLGDIVFVELPDTGTVVDKGKEAAVVESVKAASEIFAPVRGTITQGNQNLVDTPALVNEDAEGAGWFFQMSVSDASDLDGLMDQDAYKTFVDTES